MILVWVDSPEGGGSNGTEHDLVWCLMGGVEWSVDCCLVMMLEAILMQVNRIVKLLLLYNSQL